MGWADYYRRRDALNSVIERGELAITDEFTSTGELLQALHHRWSLRLAGRVELASLAENQLAAVGAAWREAAGENLDLRRLLDEHADHPALREVTLAERRMIATAAGLADPQDGADEQAGAGAAFVAMLRNGSQRRRFLRRLVPSG
ncbi:MAG: hypothetical protein ACRDSK_31100 [Actinophytocola sp.]|uniref:hypothetical protein n=1 Tax=Actinophytocola sp. TaxID=1872138 RepID=UPI003D6B791C